jgi:hypothetical protein
VHLVVQSLFGGRACAAVHVGQLPRVLLHVEELEVLGAREVDVAVGAGLEFGVQKVAAAFVGRLRQTTFIE